MKMIQTWVVVLGVMELYVMILMKSVVITGVRWHVAILMVNFVALMKFVATNHNQNWVAVLFVVVFHVLIIGKSAALHLMKPIVVKLAMIKLAR